MEDIKIYCPEDRDIFYDGGKYLERALLDHGSEPVTDIRCAVDKWEDNVNKLCERLRGTPSPDMSYRKHVLNLLFEANTQQPIDILWVEGTSMPYLAFVPCNGFRYMLIANNLEIINPTGINPVLLKIGGFVSFVSFLELYPYSDLYLG